MTQTPPGEPRRDGDGSARPDSAAAQSAEAGASRPRRSILDRAKSALHPNNRRLLAEMIRYGLVSVIALVVDYGTLFLCYEVFGWHYLTAATLAFALGIIANFICSRIWVFDKSKHHTWVEVAIFLAVGVTGLGLNNLIMFLAHDKFGVPVMVSKLISTAIVFFWNFLLRRFLIYTGVEDDQKSAEDGNSPADRSPGAPSTQYGANSHDPSSGASEHAPTAPNSSIDVTKHQEGSND